MKRYSNMEDVKSMSFRIAGYEIHVVWDAYGAWDIIYVVMGESVIVITYTM